MEYLSEAHSKLLLAKEWLVKVDNDRSTPYLFKFYSSTVDLNCLIVITDTKHVWSEVLSSRQLARRWRDCNPQDVTEDLSHNDEESWRLKSLEFVTTLHSLGGVANLTFEQVKSNYSDLAFELRNDTFRWRWETFSVGPTMSAEILSKHLIMPLISATHLAFFSGDPIGSLPEDEVEKSVDRVGRVGRRAVDTHVKNTLSRPLVATTLRRMGAIFNFVPDPPRIVAEVQTPDLRPPFPPPRPSAAPELLLHPAALSPSAPQNLTAKSPSKAEKSAPWAPSKSPQADGSVTEEEPDEEDYTLASRKGKEVMTDRRGANARSCSPVPSVPSRSATPNHLVPLISRKGPKRCYGEPSSPVLQPPQKKSKQVPALEPLSDDSSKDGQKACAGQAKSSTRRGVKQPIKRGGKRF
ncbi:hypothetical protein BC628DRAFT_1485355 [Trametes gibbosa]|nr:hypothetical protein BC628DRAFT_1485355 [Trametes gibbosa]